MAAPDINHIMTLDHKAAYLNANLWDLQAPMLPPIYVSVIIFYMNSNKEQFLRKHGKPLPRFYLLPPSLLLPSFFPS